MTLKSVNVCLSPALLPFYELENTTAVVIDIFRASSSMCYGLANGARAIIPVAEIDECLAYKEKGYLLAAERDGRVVDGFDFGNSPFAYTEEKVKGKTIVLTTTNGTYAIDESKKRAHQVIVGSFINLDAVCTYLKSQNKDILLLCAGWKNRFNLEDTLFAGAVVSQLGLGSFEFDDAAYAAEDLYLQAKDDLAGYTSKASHGKRMQRLNLQEDIKFCLNHNLTDTIPILVGDRLIKM